MVCVCVDACVCIDCTLAQSHVCRGQRLTLGLGILLYCSPHWLWDRVSHWTHDLSQTHWSLIHSPLAPSTGITGMRLSTSFYMVLGAELMSSCLLSKHFAHWVVSPAPTWLLMKFASVLSVLRSPKHLMSTYILSLPSFSVLDLCKWDPYSSSQISFWHFYCL